MLNETPEDADYDPNPLLDLLIEKLKLKNDAALCRMLGVSPPVISKMRHRVLRVGSSMLIRMHEESGMSIRELRELMGDRRTKTRVSNIYRAASAQDRTPDAGAAAPNGKEG
ncbi:hypothetical protein BH11PSE11_BH11PSE11_20480 [soil metagenome]